MQHLATIFVLLTFAFTASAQTPVDEATKPEFVEAVETWLNGEDLAALKTLSVLAQGGHVPSKILLSRIADTPWLSAHITEGMPRKERIALFREPKGLSGRDWLSSASKDSDLARALWATQNGAPREAPNFEENMATLVKYGEAKPLLIFFLETWKFGREEAAIRAIIENEALFGAAGRSFLGFAILSMVQDGSQPPLPADINTTEKARAFLAGLTSEINRFAASGSYSLGTNRVAVPAQPDGIEALSGAVEALPELTPLVQYCEATCSVPQQETCRADTVWAMAQAGRFPFPFASPAQSLIPDEQYWASLRFRGDLERTLDNQDWPGCR